MAWGNNTYVAVGAAGTVLTSPDGNTWSANFLHPGPVGPTTPFLEAVAFGAGNFIGVGRSGLIMASPDGVTWTTQTSGTSNNLWSTIYSGSQFVASGDNGTVLTSPDGTTWTANATPVTDSLRFLAYGNGAYVAFGLGSVLKSADAVTWTQQFSLSGCCFFGGTFANNQFVGIADNAAEGAYTSPDGTTWTGHPLPTGFSGLNVTYGNGEFAVIGQQISGTRVPPAIATSSDAATWAVHTFAASKLNGQQIAFLNGKFFALGEYGDVFSSTDAVTWKRKTTDVTNDSNGDVLNSVTFGNGTYVVVGSGGQVLTSNDGITWQHRSSGVTSTLEAVAYFNNVFIAVGGNGVILTSSDGATWTARPGGGGRLNSIAIATGEVVATGTETVISTDGISWNAHGVNQNIRSITFASNQFAGVNQNRNVYLSSDGSTWTTHPAAHNSLYSVAYGGGTLVAVGLAGTIVTSTDGVTWTPRSSATGFDLYGVAYTNGQFIAVGLYGTILSSSDGATWTQMSTPPFDAGLASVVSTPGGSIAVGNTGAIFRM